jgi:probable phosphomutase (TIGR03848 family)
MTTFFFVRHGVTSHTGAKLTGWMPGVGLSDEGRAEAKDAASALSSVRLDAVYSSPIERTIETAEIIAEPHRLEVGVREDLGEVRYGRWTNRSLKSLARTKLWERIQRWPSGARFPDGETLGEVQARAIAALEELRTLHPRGRICCVSHADVIRLVVAHYLGVHIDLFQRIVIGPASITVVSVGDSGPRVLGVNVPATHVESRAPTAANARGRT